MAEQAESVSFARTEAESEQSLSRLFLRGMLACAAVALALEAAGSMRWRMEHDAPLMHYVAFAMTELGEIPYRDLFEMNMPGTYALHVLAVKLFGTSDLGFRAWDLIWTVGVMAATYGWVRRFGRIAGLFAALASALIYFRHGQGMTLQREYLALLPTALALCLVPPGSGERRPLRLLGAGALWGIAILIKPPFILFSLGSVLFSAIDFDAPRTTPLVRRPRFGVALALIAGSLLPIAIALAWLAANGALEAFLDIVRGYWPLYNNLSGFHEPIAGVSRLLYLAFNSARELWHPLLLAALFALVVLIDDPRSRRAGIALAVLCATAFAYVVLLGKFWFYHLLPFDYFLVCTVGASLSVWQQRPQLLTSRVAATLAIAILGVLTLTGLTTSIGDLKHIREPVVVKEGVPDRIGTFLRDNLRPGDRVQPLDWTGGAVHGLLLAHAHNATPFIYDFHFYHHVDEPYTQKLRTRIVSALEKEPPRFVVQIDGNRPWPVGRRTSRSFPELEQLLAARYRVAVHEPTYRIFERAP